MKLEINETSQFQSFNNDFLIERVIFTENDSQYLLRTAVKLAQEGNRAEAKQLLFKVTDSEPDNETAWLWLASISEYPEELLISLQNVLKINPENERALEWAKATKSLLAKTFVQRGIDVFNNNEKDFARQCFLQAIVHDAENEMAWLWLASVTELVDEKISYLQKVLSFNAENETALTTLKTLKDQTTQSLLRKANSAAISGDRETAQILLEEVMKDSPNLEEAWILKAYLADGFYEKLSCYEEVLQLNPGNEAAQAGIASLKILMEKVEADTEVPLPVSEIQSEDIYEQSSQDEVLDFHYNADGNIEEKAENLESAVESFKNEPEELVEVINTYELPANEPENSFLAEEKVDSYFQNQAETSNPEVVAYEDYSSSLKPEFLIETESAKAEESVQEFEMIQEEKNLEEESEIELINAQSNENNLLVENEETELLLDVEEDLEVLEEDSESYLIDDTKIPSLSDFKFSEDEEENLEVLSEENGESTSEINEEPVFETNAQNIFSSESESENIAVLENSSTVNNYETSPVNNYLSNYNQLEETSYNENSLTVDEEAVDPVLENEAFEEIEVLEDYFDNSSKIENQEESETLEDLQIETEKANYFTPKISDEPAGLVSDADIETLQFEETEKQNSKIEEVAPVGSMIMVIDDSPTVRKLISDKLEKSGHSVITAINGADALTKINETVPDLILLDIAMPKMDGYQVCKMIRSNQSTKDVPVVMISGKDGFFDKARGRMVGSTGYITKPFGPETLMKTIENYIN